MEVTPGSWKSHKSNPRECDTKIPPRPEMWIKWTIWMIDTIINVTPSITWFCERNSLLSMSPILCFCASSESSLIGSIISSTELDWKRVYYPVGVCRTRANQAYRSFINCISEISHSCVSIDCFYQAKLHFKIITSFFESTHSNIMNYVKC